MAPLTMWHVIRAKVILTLPPVLVLTLLFGVTVATLSGSGIAQLVALAVLVVWLGLGFVSIGVSAGGIDPRFEASDDRRAVGLLGTLAGLGGSFGFGLLSVGAFALFVFGLGAVEGTTTHLGPIPATPAIGALMWAGGVILVAGAVAVVGTLLWVANSRLGSYEGTIAST